MTEAKDLELQGALAYRAGLPLCACSYRGTSAEWWEDGWWLAYRREHPPLRHKPTADNGNVRLGSSCRKIP